MCGYIISDNIADHIKQANATFITLSNLTSIVVQYGVPNIQEALRDIVILGVISFFITPVTIIIYKHTPGNTDDTTWHHLPVHKDCDKKHCLKWLQFIDRMVLDVMLFNGLWRDYFEHKGHVDLADD